MLTSIVRLWFLSGLWLFSIARADGDVRPNIVFILIDDLRYDTFGYMDHPFVETPHIDRMATKGAQLTNAFVTTSLCSPSRASFLTGSWMHRHRVVDNQSRIPEGTITFPQRLQRSGYTTAFIGKWHMGGSSDAPRPGFDHWVSFRGQGRYAPENQYLNVNGRSVPQSTYMTDELTTYATAWLNERTGETPFLLYLSHKGVHGLYDPAPRHRDRYRTAPWSPPQSTPSLEGHQPMWVSDQRNSWHGVEFPYYGRSGQSITEMYRPYSEMILSIDDSVGEVLKTLQELGVAENTFVVFTSDGGHLWGEHGLIDKRCAYEESIRIPMLAYGPGLVSPGAKIHDLITNLDVAPTFLEAAAVPVPDSMDGKSFLSLLDGTHSGQEFRRELLYEYYWEPNYPQTPTMFALRGKRYKLIQYHGIWDSDEFYDLVADPMETRNLIYEPQHQAQITQTRERLYQRLNETDGLIIPLGFKRNQGSNQRTKNGSTRAEFPAPMLRP